MTIDDIRRDQNDDHIYQSDRDLTAFLNMMRLRAQRGPRWMDKALGKPA